MKNKLKFSQDLVDYAKSLGFADVGVSKPQIDISNVEHIQDYIKNNYNASMKWIERNPEIRVDAAKLLDGAKSVLCFVHPVPIGKIKFPDRARFAQGEDYHKVIKNKLGLIVEELKKEYPEIKTKICVDTSPIFEKAFAANAGLGLIGKHTLLIHPRHGSNIVLGEIILDIQLSTFNHQPSATLSCGSCTKCIDSCPTKALIAPYKLDARRCVSYLTIENKGSIPEEFQKYIGKNQYGCDVCINACPFSKMVDG